MTFHLDSFETVNWDNKADHMNKAEQTISTSRDLSVQGLQKHNLDQILDKPEKLDVDTLLGNVTKILEATDVYDIPEPTPIEQNRIEIVDQVPLTAASWHHDKSISMSLQSILADQLKESVSQEQPETQTSSMEVRSITPPTDESPNSIHQKGYTERWNERYQELVEFQEKYNHCLVPLNWVFNPSLGHWVKRQRYQYSLKLNGIHSTMTREREEALEKLGFVWDSHAALWEERWNELRSFRETHKHCYVPSRYAKNPKLSIWVKCQRRQFKLLVSGRKSNMTQERITRLKSLGFVFNPRDRKH